MERITMSLDESLSREFDRLIQGRGYASPQMEFRRSRTCLRN